MTALPKDPTALRLGVASGRYDVSDTSVRAALREHLFGRTRTALPGLRTRAAGAADVVGDTGTVRGYASVFGVAYDVGGRTKEVIRKGAFAASLREQDGVLPLMYEHDWSAGPVGVALAAEDAKGVLVSASLFVDTERGRSVYRAAKASAVREWSIGFIAHGIETSERDGYAVEAITRGDLIEVSLVLRGASPATAVTGVS